MHCFSCPTGVGSTKLAASLRGSVLSFGGNEAGEKVVTCLELEMAAKEQQVELGIWVPPETPASAPRTAAELAACRLAVALWADERDFVARVQRAWRFGGDILLYEREPRSEDEIDANQLGIDSEDIGNNTGDNDNEDGRPAWARGLVPHSVAVVFIVRQHHVARDLVTMARVARSAKKRAYVVDFRESGMVVCHVDSDGQ